jgi:hypothetical protein
MVLNDLGIDAGPLAAQAEAQRTQAQTVMFLVIDGGGLRQAYGFELARQVYNLGELHEPGKDFIPELPPAREGIRADALSQKHDVAALHVGTAVAVGSWRPFGALARRKRRLKAIDRSAL